MAFINEKQGQKNKISEKIADQDLNLFNCWKLYQKACRILEAHTQKTVEYQITDRAFSNHLTQLIIEDVKENGISYEGSLFMRTSDYDITV